MHRLNDCYSAAGMTVIPKRHFLFAGERGMIMPVRTPFSYSGVFTKGIETSPHTSPFLVFRRAVLFQPGDDADFARLLVPDNQHVLLILFLFHTLLLLIKNEIVSPTKVAAINRPAMGDEPCGSLWLPSGSLWLYAFCFFSPFFPSDSLKWIRRNSCTSDSL